MNDLEIRNAFHQKYLRHHLTHKDTIIVEELGLNHGKCRADIAVLNGHFIGFEIKSDNDSLRRLKDQIKSYNMIFDRIYIIVGNRYSKIIHEDIPSWWGIIKALKNKNDTIFSIVREAKINKNVDPIFIARLLWRKEVLEALEPKQFSAKILRQPRTVLYEYLVDLLDLSELKAAVKYFLKNRNNWRCPEPLPRYDDLFQPISK